MIGCSAAIIFSINLPTLNRVQSLTIFRSDQCPYLDDAVNTAVEVAQERGIDYRIIELTTADEVRRLAPTPYGVFSLVLDGKLWSYHFLLKEDFLKHLNAVEST